MVRRLLGHMTGPRRRRAIHKVQLFLRMHSGNLAVTAGCPQYPLPLPPQRSAVSWSSPVLSAVSGHLLYFVRSLWSSPVPCPQSLVI
ncbi:unnamed protein product, partial [Staurois parvus]